MFYNIKSVLNYALSLSKIKSRKMEELKRKLIILELSFQDAMNEIDALNKEKKILEDRIFELQKIIKNEKNA